MKAARLFVAVWPPDEVFDRVAALPRPPVAGLRWTDRAQWHVTLRFLGRVDDPADAVAAVAAMNPVPGAPPEAVLGPEVRAFGRRVLHVPVAGLDQLAAAVTVATAAVGQPPEDRPFAGHLTVARVARGATVDLRPLTVGSIGGSWRVHEVCLVQSRLSSAGATYEVLERFALDR